MIKLAILALLASCAVEAPRITYSLTPVEAGEVLPSGARGEGWAQLGVVEVEPGQADVEIWYDLNVSGLAEQAGSMGVADRDARVFYLDARLSGFRLAAVAAHEIGHVVLDTPEHASCGIMSGADVLPCAEDQAVVDRALGAP